MRVGLYGEGSLDSKGALRIRIGFWGPLYYNYGEEPLKIVQVILKSTPFRSARTAPQPQGRSLSSASAGRCRSKWRSSSQSKLEELLDFGVSGLGFGVQGLGFRV